jgi:2-polyprenyl-3-methyl-5-hydroxy-6-metoxy-1,4-benzoquinol methylase
MVTIPLTESDEAQVEEFAGNLFMACLATMELANVELGLRLGLYDVLTSGPATPAELSERAGIHERYASEWLEQQTVAGVLKSDGGVFSLPNAHAHVLLDDDSEACLKVAGAIVPWAGTALGIMEKEFREGKGVSFGAFDLHDIQAAFTRPVFEHQLTQTWLPAVGDVHDRLAAGEQVRVADIGCGEGLSAVKIARTYPHARIDGYDLDEASIAAAKSFAEAAGVADRVTFHLVDAATIAGPSYDLVLLIEMLHDVPDPVGVLTAARRLAGAGGTVLVVDERTEDAFNPEAGEMERLFYTFSTLHCLAVSMQNGGAGTGTVIRADTVREYATRAGFADVEVLDVDHPQFRLYRLS